ncbi:hypothetical protein PV04_09487 [Phialophora macrospora]|uniref:CorA-like transporter domain-containing protein n=1 Tax=Phialophora macrospora TaxID=1851006 RepID=A0A0D2DQW1_9EURO|nr:hypothetical protein PV04_09487 [Phialophora macrospora]
MTGGLQAPAGNIIRRLGDDDSRLWESVQEDLFLDEGTGRSRVEAFPAHLLVGHQKSESDKVQTPATEDYKVGDEEEATSVHLVALTSSAHLSDYIRETSKCRTFFIRQTHSWGPLLVSSELFSELMVKARVPPRLKSFIVFFGTREREGEIAPPALRFMPLQDADASLEGSHECTYGLRFVERNRRHHMEAGLKTWSLRQCAVSCRYTPTQDGTSWAFITISADMQQRLNVAALAGDFRQDTDPFEVHQLILDSAVSSWRQYLIDLAEETDAQYAQILGTSPNDKGPVSLHQSGRRQDLLMLDEKLLNSMLAITATMDTSSALSSTWESLVRHWHAPSADYLELMRASFDYHQRSLGLLATEITHLRTKLAGVTNLLSSFLDLSSGYSLHRLALESGKENEEMRRLTEQMHKLAEKSTRDAAAVKVLTILTLIYLPITVVSNFFSTSFVSATTSASGSGHISVTGDWWILLAASVPLTVLTIYIWLVWTRMQANPRRQAWWNYVLGIHLWNGEPPDSTFDNEKATVKPGRPAYIGASYAGKIRKESAPHALRRTSSGLC